MTYGITGIKHGLGPGEQVPLRREIDEWWFSKDVNDLNQRSLFIYALHKFMKMTPNPDDPNDLSYFSIAGIHGEPLKPWDNNDTKGSWYCAHSDVLFPTWHRPYMLLYEQRLYEIMRDLIPTTFASSDQAAMFRAAETWRLPYWDWAMKKPNWDMNDPDSSQNLEPRPTDGPNVPFLLTQKMVEVKTLTGAAPVPNPMWRYILPENIQHPDWKTFNSYGITDVQIEDGPLLRYSECKATNRHPSTYDPADPRYTSDWINGEEQNWQKIRGELRGFRDEYSNTLPETVYRLFSTKPGYLAFATAGWIEGQSPEEYISLEGIHNKIHGFTGGAGHMGKVPVAAFDPIFWMHHCNIDRLLAMWQAIYDSKYDDWVNKSVAKRSLAPFHADAEGTPHTSVTCSFQQQQLGYTYPELQKWLEKYKTNGTFDKKKYQADIRATIELKYSTTGKSALQLPNNDRIATHHMSAMTARNLAIENFPPILVQKAESVLAEPQRPLAPPPVSWEENDYVVNVVYNRFALGGHPYNVRIFLGDVPSGPPFYFMDCPTEVGLVYNFNAPATGRGDGPEGCENCRTRQEQGALDSGQIVLTDYLVENITKEREQRGLTLTSLSRDEVAAYLRTNLHWRISDQNDVTVPKEDMPSLKISVAMGKATHFAETARFSEYSDYEVLWEVTEGRLAGANPGELGLRA